MSEDITGEHYWQASVWLLEVVVLLVVSAVVSAAAPVPVGVLALAIPAILLFPISLFWYWAIYRDSKLLSETADWTPRWWAWVVGGLLLTPALLAPLYLLLRRSKVGLGDPDWFIIR